MAEPIIPPDLANAFEDAVGMYGVCDPRKPDERCLSVNGQPYSIPEVCRLVSRFTDQLPDNVVQALKSYMDAHYSSLKERLSEDPSYVTGADCLSKLMEDRKTEYQQRHSL